MRLNFGKALWMWASKCQRKWGKREERGNRKREMGMNRDMFGWFLSSFWVSNGGNWREIVRANEWRMMGLERWMSSWNFLFSPLKILWEIYRSSWGNYGAAKCISVEDGFLERKRWNNRKLRELMEGEILVKILFTVKLVTKFFFSLSRQNLTNCILHAYFPKRVANCKETPLTSTYWYCWPLTSLEEGKGDQNKGSLQRRFLAT